jgi:3-hydroxyacyl-[acyl-carrier-protein] dehydratase
MNQNERKFLLSNDEVRKYLPHRQPFQLVDRVIEIRAVGSPESVVQKDRLGSVVVAQKNISYSDPIFQGHFPEFSIFPGVMMIEAMAQTSSFTLYHALMAKKEKGYLFILVGVDECRFRRPVTPGDVLMIQTTLSGGKGPIWSFDCEVSVDGQKVAEAKIIASLQLAGQSGARPV